MSTGSSAPKIKSVPEANAPAAETVLEPVPLDRDSSVEDHGRSIGKHLPIPSRRGAVQWLRQAPDRMGNTLLLFLAIVLIPTSIYSGYMFFVATPLYVAETKFAIRSLGPRQSRDIAAGLFSNMSSEKVEDANQVLSFVESSKMLEALDEQAGFTAVMFQVRGNGTALYPSAFEVWSERFEYRDPGFELRGLDRDG